MVNNKDLCSTISWPAQSLLSAALKTAGKNLRPTSSALLVAGAMAVVAHPSMAQKTETLLKLGEVELKEVSVVEEVQPSKPATATTETSTAATAPAATASTAAKPATGSASEDETPRKLLETFAADRRGALPAHDLTIEDVRRISLENNLALKAQNFRPEIARENFNQENARFEPIFQSAFTLSSTENAPDPGSNAITLDGYNASVGVGIPLRTGGNVEISLPTTFTSPDIPNVNNIQDTSLQFSVSHPLLRNAGRAIAETPIRLAGIQTEQEEARTRLAAIQTLAAAEAAYWDFYAASAALDVRYDQYASALEVERKARRLAEVDVISDIEVTRAESGVARRLEGVIVAESTRRTTQRALKQVMNDDGLPLFADKNLIALSDPQPVYEPVDRYAVADAAIANRQELVDLQLQLTAEQVAELFAKNQLKPVLDLNASATLADRDDNFGDSLGAEFNSWQVGATFNLPLGNQAAKAQARRAALQIELAETNIANRQRVVTQEVLDSLDLLERSWQQILAARNETVLAARTYQAEERQFLAGIRTSTDVLEALDFLAEAQLREVQSLSFHERQKVAVAVAMGSLLERGQIKFQ
jgi:outer membrane protein TolC